MLPSSLYFTSRKTGIDSRMPNGSLLSLRTFYAFGARSGRIPSLQRSLSYNPHGNSLCVGPLQQFTETSNTLRRSFTSSTMHHSLKRSTAYYNRRYFTPSYNISKPYSSAFVNANQFSKWNRKQNHEGRTERIILPKILRNTGISTMQTTINTRSPDNTDDTGLQWCEQLVNVAAAPEIKNVVAHSHQAVCPSDEMSKAPEDCAEMIALKEKNKSLEEEVRRLTLKLQEKECSEREFKRKTLEYAAEIKVWKKKYKMQKLTATVEISESNNNEKEISDIMEQLNNAAEKLTRLDAVKDLKLLQSEMETALKEISE